MLDLHCRCSQSVVWMYGLTTVRCAQARSRHTLCLHTAYQVHDHFLSDRLQQEERNTVAVGRFDAL